MASGTLKDSPDNILIASALQGDQNAYSLLVQKYREGLTLSYIIDKQWDKFLWELIWTVVIRAVRHYHRHTIGVVERPHEMI